MAMQFIYTYLVVHMRTAVLGWTEGLSSPVSSFWMWSVMNT